MPWIPSHQSLRDHPKKDHLAELLFNGTTPNDVADYAAAGVLHYLWYWALDYAHDGDLSKFTDRQVAKGVGWQGDPKLLMQALTSAGFIDEDRHVHDWEQYAGKLIVQRERDKERVKSWREKASKKVVTRNVQGRVDKSKASAGARASIDAAPRARAKAKVPVDNYCPKDGATLQADGHCPVCAP